MRAQPFKLCHPFGFMLNEEREALPKYYFDLLNYQPPYTLFC